MFGGVGCPERSSCNCSFATYSLLSGCSPAESNAQKILLVDTSRVCEEGGFMEWLGIVRRHALACMMILFVAASMFGQSGRTSVRGVITDQKGASVPNATLTLTSPDIGVTLTTQTDKDGAYQSLRSGI